MILRREDSHFICTAVDRKTNKIIPTDDAYKLWDKLHESTQFPNVTWKLVKKHPRLKVKVWSETLGIEFQLDPIILVSCCFSVLASMNEEDAEESSDSIQSSTESTPDKSAEEMNAEDLISFWESVASKHGESRDNR